jgi:hypothetical protein
MKATEPDQNLTFDWPRREGFSFVLFGCVCASLVAHAATFFLFQVADPVRTTIPRPAPQVSILTPSSPENIALLNWIAAEDPALVASANSVNPPAILDVKYRPSYAVMRTSPIGPVDEPVTVPFPAGREPLAVITGVAQVAAPAAIVHTPHPTRITFSGALASREIAAQSPLVLKSRPSDPVEPARWLAGVSDRGEVRFLFLQASSGNPALDEQAAAHLQTLEFSPSAEPITWGIAIVSWGDETYGDPAKSDSRKSTGP